MRRSLGLEICKKMEIKIDETYHVVSCCLYLLKWRPESVVLAKCPIQNGTEIGTPGDEGNICPPGGRGVPDCSVSFVFTNLGLSSLQNLLYSSPGVQSSVLF